MNHYFNSPLLNTHLREFVSGYLEGMSLAFDRFGPEAAKTLLAASELVKPAKVPEGVE